MIAFPRGLEPVDELSPADWVRERLKDWPAGRSFLVRDLVPPVYEAYARVLHRAHTPEDGGDPTGTWAERASQLGRSLGSETSWYDLTGTTYIDGSAQDAWVPGEGDVSLEEMRSIASLVRRHTATPLACWFGMWSGWAPLSGGGASLYRAGGPISQRKKRLESWRESKRARREAARFKTFPLLGGGRSYLLFHGAVEDATRFDLGFGFRSPTLLWPNDRAWFVHTEIDALSTYIGGSRALMDRLVGGQILESFEVHADSLAAL